jgi:predicted O-methyltransferase YrrM
MILRFLNPKFYWDNLVYYWHIWRYDAAAMQRQLVEQMAEWGFSYADTLEGVNQVLTSLGRSDYNAQIDAVLSFGSIHWLLFYAIGQTTSVRRILEIGTYDGETAFLLSKIFPHSEILTLDLPEDDPILRSTYHREQPEALREFIELRNYNITQPNIDYIAKNSFFAPEILAGQFDLIWVDGGHLYPEIAWDICNAYHLCAPGGWILCDDVMTHPRAERTDYVSSDSHHVLEYVAARAQTPLAYFIKRTVPAWSANPRRRKFVAVMRKLQDNA